MVFFFFLLTLFFPQLGFLQGGSFENKISIYGESFEDESYSIKHNVEGILGLANDGFPHTNTS